MPTRPLPINWNMPKGYRVKQAAETLFYTQYLHKETKKGFWGKIIEEEYWLDFGTFYRTKEAACVAIDDHVKSMLDAENYPKYHYE